jgi:predicted Zn-dependent protease
MPVPDKIINKFIYLYFFLGVLTGLTVEPAAAFDMRLISPQQEVAMGEEEFAKLKGQIPVSRDPRLNGMVQEVGGRIASVTSLPGARWEFAVFNHRSANAFCLPGGKVGVFTGIMPIAQDELGLATVIGHEVAHAARHHAADRVSQSALVNIGAQVLDGFLGGYSREARELWLAAYGIGTGVGYTLPYARDQELEADRLGLQLMARAGYDPRAAVDFWQRFADYNRRQGGGSIEFLSTHPVDARRISQLRAALPQAVAEYQRSGAQRRQQDDEIYDRRYGRPYREPYPGDPQYWRRR